MFFAYALPFLGHNNMSISCDYLISYYTNDAPCLRNVGNWIDIFRSASQFSRLWLTARLL